MSSATLVNLINTKLRTGRVVFVDIREGSGGTAMVKFEYGFQVYDVLQDRDGRILVGVLEQTPSGLRHVVNNGSRWIEGVLNGMVRNDAGNLVLATDQSNAHGVSNG